MNTSLVSVIIPAYNAEDYIAETVQSVLSQTYRNIEVLVIDDGSKDQTRERLTPYLNKIRYIHQSNQGESVARNHGLRQSRGEYIVFLDADDILCRDMVEQSVFALSQKSEFRVVYGHRVGFVHPDPERLLPITPVPATSGNVLPDIIRGATLVPGQFLVHKECLEHLGGFAEDMQFGEDWEFLLRLAKDFPFCFISEPFIKKRIHPAMQTLAKNRPDIVELRKGILKRVFGPRADEMSRRYLSPAIIADWYRTFGYSFVNTREKGKAREYLIKSLMVWPFQPRIYLWLMNQLVPGGVKAWIRSLKKTASQNILS